ncbi:helix-turn-helix transcriptional regulator [Planomonospora sp. ID67723]|uniref:PadR family transcriptional regulator n=1 Tax=Planomonospora sp. ID67723 TaxID=2738134 RepID=UPI0018C39358|nr:helix-turn-helix transcriptional regulator [Planomonospora sp. ID67723]MBG0831430.1 helix-turn-helix transcriptional regulator [Planomonospora sp. ID67723]
MLHVLVREPSHGYAIVRSVERDSGDVLRLGEGTLYPVLRSLEHDGLVTSEWQTLDAGPARKVYRITAAGRAECSQRIREWRSRVNAIGAVLGIDGFARGGLGHA